jgi:hypothetical protein
MGEARYCREEILGSGLERRRQEGEREKEKEPGQVGENTSRGLREERSRRRRVAAGDKKVAARIGRPAWRGCGETGAVENRARRQEAAGAEKDRTRGSRVGQAEREQAENEGGSEGQEIDIGIGRSSRV